MVEVGQQAPEFELPSTGGADVKLSEAAARHRALIVAFYALDFTAG